MKMSIGFIMGIAMCSLAMFGARAIMPIQAESEIPDDISDNVTGNFLDFLPDIELIYRESLTKPFIKAQDEIYDEDIAEFYQELMDDTGLTDPDGYAN